MATDCLRLDFPDFLVPDGWLDSEEQRLEEQQPAQVGPSAIEWAPEI